jgi:formate dehydrogenase iron-sulfur subunit
MGVALLIDTTRCKGCEACVYACKEVNGLPKAGAEKLQDITWTTIDKRGGLNIKRQCMHCLNPTCVSVCPVGALEKTSDGPVTYDADKCMGCRYCMVACPFGIPKYQWGEAFPKVQKCILCAEKRLSKGLKPACASVCPSGATTFGDREALIAEARDRIRSQPHEYIDHIYGLEEAGGTSVLYLSCIPFEAIGFPTDVQTSDYPQLTWDILSKIPNVVSTGGVVMFGIWWIVNRRMQLAGQDETDSSHTGEEG